MSYVGTMIKMLRETNNMSQEDLGKRLGIGRAAVNKYEKGVVENIPVKTIEKIAMIFETSPAILMGWETDTESTSCENRVLSGVAYFYGKDSTAVLTTFSNLPKAGRTKVLTYLTDLEKLYSSEIK